MSAVVSTVQYPHQPGRLDNLNEPELRDIIAQFGELPDAVLQVQFTHINGRQFDDYAFAVATCQLKTQGSDEDWVIRLQRRSTSLTPYIGKYLICVFVRLPGIHYTIEIDPHERRVVHWEWQAT